MKLKFVAAIFLVLFFVSCASKRPHDFTIYYKTENNTGLDKLIDINGYYITRRECDSTFKEAFIFYDNGLFAIVTGTDLTEASKCFYTNDKTTGCENILWGLYELKHDTIRTQTLRQEGFEYYVIHRDYLIGEKQTIINLSEYVNCEKTKIGYLKNYPSFIENECQTEGVFYPRKDEKRNTRLCPLIKNKWFVK